MKEEKGLGPESVALGRDCQVAAEGSVQESTNAQKLG